MIEGYERAIKFNQDRNANGFSARMMEVYSIAYLTPVFALAAWIFGLINGLVLTKLMKP